MSNEEGMIKNLEYLPGLGASDHVILQFQLAGYSPIAEPVEPRLNLSKGNYRQLNVKLSSVDWASVDEMDTQTMYTFIKDTLTTLSRKYIPRAKPRSTNKNLYINHDALRLKKHKRTLWLKYMHTRDVLDHVRFTRARNKLRTVTRSLRANFERRLVTDIRDNPKGFWRYAGSRLRTRTRVEDLQADDGTMAREDHDKASLLNKYFHSVFTIENEIVPSLPNVFAGPSLEDVDISAVSVREKLVRLNTDRAPGPDGLHPRVLRETAVEMAEPWARLFRSSLDSGCLPSDWQIDEIIPIFKNGSKQLPANYRPVALTAVPCKVLESLVRDQLMDHLTRTKQLSGAQHGYRRKRSCCTQFLETLDEWASMLEEGDPVDALYLDCSKAFNSVPHQRLLLKLRSCGVGGKLLNWIEAFLTGRRQRVAVNGVKSG